MSPSAPRGPEVYMRICMRIYSYVLHPKHVSDVLLPVFPPCPRKQGEPDYSDIITPKGEKGSGNLWHEHSCYRKIASGG